MLNLGRDTFRHQRDSLRTLVLRGVSKAICLDDPACFDQLRALRWLAVQNMGLVGLGWLAGSGTGSPLPAVHSLNLDNNAGLELHRTVRMTLINMTSLKVLSMRKGCALGDDPFAAAADASDAERSQRTAVWSLGSIHCIAKLAAGRPALRLCF